MRKPALIIFGIFLSLIILEASLRLAGFVYLSWQDYRNSRALKEADKGEYRILCLGESTTAFGGEGSYPAQLEKIMNQRLEGKRFSVINKGLPGVDTTVIISELKRNIAKYQPRMIIAMMGINDTQETGKGSAFKAKALIKTLRVYKLARMLYERLRSRDILRKTYLERGEYHLERQHYYEAQELFGKVVELFPGKASGYLGLAKCYVEQRMYSQVQKMLNIVKAINSDNAYDYVDAGWIYYDAEYFSESETMFKRAIELNPSDVGVYVEMGQFYQARKYFQGAEENFKKAIELMPGNPWPCSVLGWYYLERGMFGQAEEFFTKALAIGPNEDAYMDLGFLRRAQGRYKEADYFFKKANPAFNVTRRNYNILKNAAILRDIKLVCVQYPMRAVDDLKRMIDFTKGIIFVDNEDLFKDALRAAKFEDYFIDRFAGDFGHCTSKGNRLLAENIARTMIKEVFNK